MYRKRSKKQTVQTELERFPYSSCHAQVLSRFQWTHTNGFGTKVQLFRYLPGIHSQLNTHFSDVVHTWRPQHQGGRSRRITTLSISWLKKLAKTSITAIKKWRTDCRGLSLDLRLNQDVRSWSVCDQMAKKMKPPGGERITENVHTVCVKISSIYHLWTW